MSAWSLPTGAVWRRYPMPTRHFIEAEMPDYIRRNSLRLFNFDYSTRRVPHAQHFGK